MATLQSAASSTLADDP